MNADDSMPWSDVKYRDLTKLALARLLELPDDELHCMMPGMTRHHVQTAIVRVVIGQEDVQQFLAGLQKTIEGIDGMRKGLKREVESLRKIQLLAYPPRR